MRESARHLSALRKSVARQSRGRSACGRFACGHAGLDAFLGGGIARGRIHEIFGTDAGDAAGAAGFAAMLALRAQAGGRPLLWLRTGAAARRCGRLYAPGLVELGGDPDSIVLADAPDDRALLRGAADALRCGGLGAVVIECWGDPPVLDLTASRRLALAAEKSGVTALLLRIAAQPAPSAAETRWAAHSAPSVPLEANAPGHPAIAVELLRRRAGAAGRSWLLEWDRDRRAFRDPALSRAVVPLPAGRSLEDRPRRLLTA